MNGDKRSSGLQMPSVPKETSWFKKNWKWLIGTIIAIAGIVVTLL